MWNDRLVRELALVLALKLAALYLIWLAFFSTPTPDPGPATLDHVLLDSGSPTTQNKTIRGDAQW